MKIKKYLSIIALGALVLAGCTKDYNDRFEGLEEKTEITDVQRGLTYTLTDADYAYLAANGASKTDLIISDVDGQADLVARMQAAGTAKAFASEEEAREIIPYYLAWPTASQFYSLSNGSSIKVTYNASVSADEFISGLTVKEYTLATADYKAVWESEEDFIAAVTPNTVGKVAANLPTDGYEAGDHVFVTYKYAESEPVFTQVGGGEGEGEGEGEGGDVETPKPEQFYKYVAAPVAEGGKYMIVAESDGKYYAAISAKVLDGGYGYAQTTEVTVTDDAIAAADVEESVVWSIEPATKDGEWLLKNEAHGAYYYNTGYSSFSFSETAEPDNGQYTYTFTLNDDGSMTITNVDKTRSLVFGVEKKQWNLYDNITEGNIFPKLYLLDEAAADEDVVVEPEFTSILGTVAKGDEVTVKGYVSAACDYGPIVSDNSGSILVYTGSGSPWKVGQTVTVSGTVSSYNTGLQLNATSGATITDDGGIVEPEYPEAVTIDAAKVNEILSRTADEPAYYCEATATVKIVDDYVNLFVEGEDTKYISFYGLYKDLKGDFKEGMNVHFTGYVSATNTSKGYVNVVLIDFEDVAATRAAVTTPSSENKYALYKFDGSKFSAVTNVAILQPADYTAMGQSYGNITDGTQAQYLPRFLNTKYPYANADDAQYVAYKKYANSATTWAVEKYVYNGSAWGKDDTVYTDQFSRAENVWKYDPSVVIWLNPDRNDATVKEYYQAATDWVYDNVDVPLGSAGKTSGQFFVTSYGNNEYYTGASAYYNNVDLRAASARAQYAEDSYQGDELVAAGLAFNGDGYGNLADEDVQELMLKRLYYVMGKVLEQLHGDAQTVPGMNVTYTVNIALYTGTTLNSCNKSLIYNVVAPGKFEFDEMVDIE